jgi:hypothetical protein
MVAGTRVVDLIDQLHVSTLQEWVNHQEKALTQQEKVEADILAAALTKASEGETQEALFHAAEETFDEAASAVVVAAAGAAAADEAQGSFQTGHYRAHSDELFFAEATHQRLTQRQQKQRQQQQATAAASYQEWLKKRQQHRQ